MTTRSDRTRIDGKRLHRNFTAARKKAEQKKQQHNRTHRSVETNSTDPEQSVDLTAQFTELTIQIARAQNFKSALKNCAEYIRGVLQAEHVAVALFKKPGQANKKQLTIDSKTTPENSKILRSNFIEAIDTALNNHFENDAPPVYKSNQASPTTGQAFAFEIGGTKFVSIPLKTVDGEMIGVISCSFGPGELPKLERQLPFLEWVKSHVADIVLCAQRAGQSSFARMWSKLKRVSRSRLAVYSILSNVVWLAFLAIPYPHHVHCPVTLHPTVKRHVTAPESGILRQLLVRPGDVVKANQTLAKLDTNEVHKLLKELDNERNMAVQKLESDADTLNTLDSQILVLQIEELNEKIDLLNARIHDMSVHSPIDGVVLQQGYNDAINSKVETGDTLMVIASLDELKANAAIDEADYRFVQPGQSTKITVNSRPHVSIYGTVDTIHPDAQLLDSRNVFIAESTIANQDRSLRPGMQGTVKIAEGKRAIGWIMFHRLWDRIYLAFN
jgi:multidrug resistance efflux pump